MERVIERKILEARDDKEEAFAAFCAQLEVLANLITKTKASARAEGGLTSKTFEIRQELAALETFARKTDLLAEREIEFCDIRDEMLSEEDA